MISKLLLIGRWILGIVFIFSGFVKGIDPWGLNYKLTDYIHAMNINWLEPLAFPGAFILPLLEFLIGAGLITGVFLRLSIVLALVFMLFFTPLTLYIAIKNPVTDCGCFGDALVITNWETFYKNIVLLIIAVFLFIKRNRTSDSANFIPGKIAFTALIIIYSALVYWSFNHEPIFDFRPYKVGVNIPEGMTIPEGAPEAVYKTTYYYKNLKTGEIRKFNDDNFPWQDTLNWKFESMDDPVIVKQGYTPPIHGFFIQTETGEDVADFFLQDENLVFILVAYNLEKSSLKNQSRINELSAWAQEQGYKFIGLTSSKGEVLADFKEKAKPAYEFYFGDEVTLKTIIRSNPGLLLLKKGTILGKWHFNDIPSAEKMKNETIPDVLSNN